MAVVGGLALGTALATGWWRISVVPEEALLRKRHEATLDIAKMYRLQLTYKQAKGTYANDFASLLSVDPDGASLKASLAANVDMTTLTVVGDANKFKIELNVVDPERTPIKVRGPIAPRAACRGGRSRGNCGSSASVERRRHADFRRRRPTPPPR